MNLAHPSSKRPARFLCAGLALYPMALQRLASSRDQQSGDSDPPGYGQWVVSGPVLSPGPEGAFDEAAVKDPSIVYHDGQYHMFYTSKPKKGGGEYQDSLGYVCAPTLEGLAHAPRTMLRNIVRENLIAVQVFYFEPQGLWYLVGHVTRGRKKTIHPVYVTNPDIGNVKGWSKPQPLIGPRPGAEKFYIDFWVICDEQNAHLFYTDHIRNVYRIETPLEQFPHGLNTENETLAMTAHGKDENGPWHLHEACHVYRVESDGRYLALLEGAYTHPTNARYWDSRNRFMFAMMSERLEGPWTRAELHENDFLAEGARLVNKQGQPVALHQVSHPELIRGGCNQRLEIKDYHLDMIFQAFDASDTPEDYDYDMLPWQLWRAQNY